MQDRSTWGAGKSALLAGQHKRLRGSNLAQRHHALPARNVGISWMVLPTARAERYHISIAQLSVVRASTRKLAEA